MRALLLAAVVTTASILGTPVIAQQATREEVGLAQGQMHSRVGAAVGAYARSIGLDFSYTTFCRTKLNMLSDAQPDNGAVPYGVNYNSISREDLKVTIQVREEFERSFLTLCLAKAKNTLRTAAAR